MGYKIIINIHGVEQSATFSKKSHNSIKAQISILLDGMKKYRVNPIDMWTERCTIMSNAYKSIHDSNN